MARQAKAASSRIGWVLNNHGIKIRILQRCTLNMNPNSNTLSPDSLRKLEAYGHGIAEEPAIILWNTAPLEKLG